MDKILTLTVNPAVDLTMTVDQVLPEHKLRAHDLQQDPGGGGLNVARVVRELGGRATAAWARGGTTGLLLEALLDREEIDHVPLPIAEPVRPTDRARSTASLATTGLTVPIVNAGMKKTIPVQKRTRNHQG